MKRLAAVLIVVGSWLGSLVIACDSTNGYYDFPSTTGFASSGVAVSGSSSGTSGTTSSSSGRPGPSNCSDRPYCGNHGCCPPSWRCLRDRCVAPGLTCTSDEDCSSDRYCALDLLEPRCFPRENFCEDDRDAGPDCIHATCMPGPDVALTQGRASCYDVSIYVYNFGRATLPPGAIIAVDSKPRTDAGAQPTDGGTDAGASPVVTTVTGVTQDGILPGEVVLLKFPHDTDEHSTLRMRVVRDAGAAATDCNELDDSDNVFNACAIPK